MNAVKHGLAGEGVAVSEADGNEIERRVLEFDADMRPESPAGVALVRRMATLSVRMEKAARWETAEQAKNVRHAADAFDEARIDEAEALFKALGEDLRRNLRQLKKMPEGVDRLVEAWRDLRDDLTREAGSLWSDQRFQEMVKLLGIPLEKARSTRLEAISRGTWGNFSSLKPEDGGDLAREPRQALCRAVLVERIDGEIAALLAHRATLDHETIALDRAEAGERALIDLSKGACLARRYEANAERGFFRSLEQFRRVEAESADRLEAAPPPESTPVTPPPPPSRAELTEKVGSFRQPARVTDFEAELATLEARFRETQARRAVEGVPVTITRAAQPAG